MGPLKSSSRTASWICRKSQPLLPGAPCRTASQRQRYAHGDPFNIVRQPTIRDDLRAARAVCTAVALRHRATGISNANMSARERAVRSREKTHRRRKMDPHRNVGISDEPNTLPAVFAAGENTHRDLKLARHPLNRCHLQRVSAPDHPS